MFIPLFIHLAALLVLKKMYLSTNNFTLLNIMAYQWKYNPILNLMYGRENCSRLFASLSGGRSKLLPKTVALAYQKYEATPNRTNQPELPPVIIMHGLLGSKNNWNSMAKLLVEKTNREIYAVDIRNHGDSPHTKEFSYELMVRDLLTFMSTQGIKNASIVGHSLGGRIGMMTALIYPPAVHSLVVVDISPVGVSPGMITIKKILQTIHDLNLDKHSVLTEARKQANIQLMEKLKDEKLVAFLLANMVLNEYNTNWRWKFNIKSLLDNFEKEVVSFPVLGKPFHNRTLFVGGTESEYLRPEDELEIKTLFRKAEFSYIKQAGHWVHADKPQEFLQVVSSFLNKDVPK